MNVLYAFLFLIVKFLREALENGKMFYDFVVVSNDINLLL